MCDGVIGFIVSQYAEARDSRYTHTHTQESADATHSDSDSVSCTVYIITEKMQLICNVYKIMIKSVIMHQCSFNYMNQLKFLGLVIHYVYQV